MHERALSKYIKSPNLNSPTSEREAVSLFCEFLSNQGRRSRTKDHYAKFGDVMHQSVPPAPKPVFALFYFVFEGNILNTSPRGAYIWRGDLTEGFLRYRFGGLIF